MSGLCDCGGEHLLILQRKAACVPRPGQEEPARVDCEGAHPAPSDCPSHGDLSWGFTQLKGPGLRVAGKDRQMVDHLGTTTFDCLQWWHLPGLFHGNNVSLKYKKNKSKPLPFCLLKEGAMSTGTAALWRSAPCSIAKLVSLFTSLAILTWNRCTSWAPGNLCCLC